ncbi:MAG: endonuclease/exonuclease/phosphatase family protein [Candidatus Limnocylindria bacterium]|jgi:endonuclease/exonuclease/phosphatase family metal-dependent hydrolase
MPLSVLTLNLWNDAGPWPERARRIREWIDRLGPDLIGFQEALRADGRDQVAELLEDRGYHVVYAPATRFWREGSDFSHGEFGNAVASRFPILESEAIALPDAGDGEKRSALSATLDSPLGPISFTCTHLHWKFRHGEVRERQVQAVCELVLRRRLRGGFPSILVGDFNAEPESAEIRFVTGLQSLGGRSVAFLDAWRTVGTGDGITWSNNNVYARANLEPDRRIDYVFTGFPMRSGVGQLLECRVVCNDEKNDVWPSDHYGVYAELRSEPLSAS